MLSFTKKLNDEMLAGLRQAALENDDLLQRAEKSFYAVEVLMNRLKEFIQDYAFADREEEIRFFRKIKPRFHKELIYWSEVIDIMANRPVGSKRKVKRYYMQVMDAMGLYFHRNQQLYAYYKLGHTENDELLFTREGDRASLTPAYTLDLDTTFSTVSSTKLAKLMAFEEVTGFLKQSMLELSGKTSKVQENDNTRRLTWTGSKAQFIEFCYGVQSGGVLNNGKANIREVVEYMGHCFNIKATHFYTYFQSMRIRKKDRTPFLKLMMEKTERRMDESDEFPRFG